MPTYEFECPTGHQFDKFYRKISDAPAEVPCPECGQTAQRRLSGGAGLIFKGSGFYITDYGKDGKKDQRSAPAKTDGAAAPAAPAGGEGAPAAKPAESKPAAEAKPAPAPKSTGSAE